MRVYAVFRSGCFLILLCLFMVEGKKTFSGKNTCRKGLLSAVTENLYIKATSIKSSVPKNCSVRNQLLSFYIQNVFGGLSIGSDNLYVALLQTLQDNLNNCVSTIIPYTTFKRLGEKGIYKAISELDILLPWIQTFIQTLI
uniref:Interleukin 26 n=1 Tax=Crocodylus porosus TaxID=8502 RepID=A0A7M4EI39_CROPO